MPTSSPLVRASAPVNESPITNEPVVITCVNAGSVAPNCFDFASAVSVKATRANVTVVAEDDTAL